jgi:hypothetical protein
MRTSHTAVKAFALSLLRKAAVARLTTKHCDKLALTLLPFQADTGGMKWNVIAQTILMCACAAVGSGQTTHKINAATYHPAQHLGATVFRPLSFSRPFGAIAPHELGAPAPSEKPTHHGNGRIVGFQRHIELAIAHGGRWFDIDAAHAAYRVAIRSNGANVLRVHFTNVSLDGQLWIYSPDRHETHGPYTAKGVNGTGDFWSPTLQGDSVIVEYDPSSADRSVPFDIPAIGHASVGIDEGLNVVSHPCSLDVSCFQNWNTAASGVGMINFMDGDTMSQCTGALVNNSRNDYTPYFLTAGHCVSNSATAQTVEVVWQYQTGSCNGIPPDPSTLPRSLGATYLTGFDPYDDANDVSTAQSDFSLLRLNSVPNMDLIFYGWSPDPIVNVGDSLVTFHHPVGWNKFVSLGTRTPDMAAPNWYVKIEPLPVDQFYEVSYTGGDLGTGGNGRVAQGSDGAPLMTMDLTIVGTMSKMPYKFTVPGIACERDPFVVQYNRLSNDYALLARYLGAGTGQLSTSAFQVSTSAPAAGTTLAASPTSLSWYWVYDNPSQTAPTFLKISTSSLAPIAVNIGANQPWISLSDQVVTVSQTSPALVRAALNPAGIVAGGELSGSITLSAGTLQTSISVSLNALSVSTMQPASDDNIVVFPLFEAGPGYGSIFTLTNPYPTETTGWITFNNYDGSPIIVQPYQLTPSDPLSSPTPQGYVYANPIEYIQSEIPAGMNEAFQLAPVAPLRQGMALAWTFDTTKQIQAALMINGTQVPPAVPMSVPFSIPFDGTGGSTQLFIYNAAWYGPAGLTVTGYDAAGNPIGSVSLSAPNRQAGTLTISTAQSPFAGKKGTLVVTGRGQYLAMGLAKDILGNLKPLVPTPVGQ